MTEKTAGPREEKTKEERRLTRGRKLAVAKQSKTLCGRHRLMHWVVPAVGGRTRKPLPRALTPCL